MMGTLEVRFPRKALPKGMMGTLEERFSHKTSPKGVAQHSSGTLFVLNATEGIRKNNADPKIRVVEVPMLCGLIYLKLLSMIA